MTPIETPWPQSPAEILMAPGPCVERLAVIAAAAVRAELLWLVQEHPGCSPQMASAFVDEMTRQALAAAASAARVPA